MEELAAPERRVGRPSSSSRLHRSERKKQLLDHAKALFLRLGYQHTTTEKIAQSAGVTEPVLYRHFDSKKTLFLEVLEEIRASTVRRWRETSERLSSPLDKLHAVVESQLGCDVSHAVDFRIMHRTLLETDDPEIAACLRGFYLDNETFLAELIRDGQQAGQFRTDVDPRVGAWELIRSALAYTLTLPLGIPHYDEPHHLPQAVGLLVGSLRAI